MLRFSTNSGGIDAPAANADLVKRLKMKVRILQTKNEGLDPKNNKMKVCILKTTNGGLDPKKHTMTVRMI